VLIARGNATVQDSGTLAADPTTAADAADPMSASASLIDELPMLPASERIERLAAFVRQAVVGVLRLPASKVPGRDHRLMDLGIDSLMAVELRNVLTRGLGISKRLPATLMFDYPTIAAIAGYLDREFIASNVVADDVRVTAEERELAGDIENMAEEDVEALLNERLGRI
jgi:hypothetical protein